MRIMYKFVILVNVFTVSSLLGMELTEKEQRLTFKPLLAAVYHCACKQVFENKMKISTHVIKEHFIEAPEGNYYMCPAEDCIEYLPSLPSFMQHILIHTRAFVPVQNPQAVEVDQAIGEQVLGKRKLDSAEQNLGAEAHLVRTLLNAGESLKIPDDQLFNLWDVNNFDCLCGKKLARKDLLREHIVDVHQRGSGECKCPKCERGFVRLADFMRHLETHSSLKRQYICKWPQCSKKFHPTERGLRTHFKEHHYHCLKCNKTFNSFEEIKAHPCHAIGYFSRRGSFGSRKGKASISERFSPSSAQSSSSECIDEGAVAVVEGDNVQQGVASLPNSPLAIIGIADRGDNVSVPAEYGGQNDGNKELPISFYEDNLAVLSESEKIEFKDVESLMNANEILQFLSEKDN